MWARLQRRANCAHDCEILRRQAAHERQACQGRIGVAFDPRSVRDDGEEASAEDVPQITGEGVGRSLPR